MLLQLAFVLIAIIIGARIGEIPISTVHISMNYMMKY